MREKIQQFGKAMLVCLSLIAISGLLLGLGGAMTSKVTVTSLGINWESYQTSLFFIFFASLKSLGSVTFSNLGLLYAVGIGFSLSSKEQGWAAFSTVVAYISMKTVLATFLSFQGLSPETTSVIALMERGFSSVDATKMGAIYTTELGYFTYRTGVFGGILVGIVVSWIHMHFYNVKLPLAFAFFAGTRSVPVLSLLGGALCGVFFAITWPIIGIGLGHLADFINRSGLFGTFLWQTTSEMLTPFGVHSLIRVPMRWTELGGSMIVDGQLVVGQSAIQLAQLASPSTDKLLVRSFMGGSWIINAAIYPGIALAMYKTAKIENKPTLKALLIPAIISTIVFGITEPMLFTFLFAAPWMYFGVYAPLAGLGTALSELFQVSVYEGNLKDLLPFLFRPEKLNLTPYLFLFPLFFTVSYFTFKYCILKFDFKTPGRIDDENEIRLNTKQEFEDTLKKPKEGNSLAHRIVEALGGKDNITDLDNCISRLRVTVKDPSLVVEDSMWKTQLGAMGIIRHNNAIQIIYGPKVAEISVDTRELLGY